MKFRVDKSPDGDSNKDRYFIMKDLKPGETRTWEEVSEVRYEALSGQEIVKQRPEVAPVVLEKKGFEKYQPPKPEKPREPKVRTKKKIEIKGKRKSGRPKGSKNKPKGKKRKK